MMSTAATLNAVPFPIQASELSDSLSTTSVLTVNDRHVLALLGKNKNKVLILIQREKKFFSSLRGVYEKRSHEFGLVAFVPEGARKNIKPETERCFDWIVFYDDSNTVYDVAKSLDDIHIPSLHLFADKLVDLVPSEKIQLIHTEETSMSEVCRVREKFGLKGTYIDDVKHMRSKELVYQRAVETGIPVAKSVYVDFPHRSDCHGIFKDVIDGLQSFPMFAKPTMMAGGLGGAKLNSEEDLKNWIEALVEDEDKTSYVVQKFLNGREFTVVCLLLPNGTWVPLAVKYYLGVSNYECIFQGKPLVVTSEQFEVANRTSFPNVYNFAKSVIEAFQPVHPQMFMVQGFQAKAGENNYVLNEMSYRPASEKVNTLFHASCGIDQFSALILSHMDPTFYPTPSKDWQPEIVTRIWYANKAGILRCQNEEPQKPYIDGQITAYWFVNEGDKIKAAKECEEMMVSLHLKSSSIEERDRDVEWICKNWAPDVKAM
ncbi:hypothetical protein L596_030807 [Steinernema carpocapsae]|uniref:ATP-grasp domain-containing protein n=3 Tax=Steinernema carpocapsae TaxID=34508 RepID=A0A4U5LNU7_STECR|nr:hypothetical protein L596_030807 [Steinernema carpocapsae]